MALIDAIKEIDEKIAERDGTPLPEAAEPTEEAAPETEQPTESPEQEVAAAPTEEAAPAKPSDADFARMRREKAAADKRAAELAAEIDRLRAPKPVEQPKPAVAVDAEPDKATNYEGWLEWKNRQLENQVQTVGKTVEDVKAWKEKTEQERQFESIKSEAAREMREAATKFAPTVPDYEDVRQFTIETIERSLKVVNPDLSGDALGKAVEMQLFRLAATGQAQGYDPIEFIYHKAKNEWGFQPKAPEPVDTPVTPPAKPSITKIAENKRKSASSLSAGGKGAPAPLSKDAIAKMKFSDITSLGPEQFQQWEAASKAFEG